MSRCSEYGCTRLSELVETGRQRSIKTYVLRQKFSVGYVRWNVIWLNMQGSLIPPLRLFVLLEQS